MNLKHTLICAFAATMLLAGCKNNSSQSGVQSTNTGVAEQTSERPSDGPGTSFSPVSYVDPFIGTDGMGHTFPGACVPFGGVQVSPDTDTIPHNVAGKYQSEVYSLCAGYRYSDNTITGFSHTHLSGTGHSDLGDVLLMPTVGTLRLNPGTAARPEAHTRPFHSSRLCLATGLFLPLGIFFWLRIWRFRIRLWRDLTQIQKLSPMIAERIDLHVLSQEISDILKT